MLCSSFPQVFQLLPRLQLDKSQTYVIVLLKGLGGPGMASRSINVRVQGFGVDGKAYRLSQPINTRGDDEL
jgi:hypothetical protein